MYTIELKNKFTGIKMGVTFDKGVGKTDEEWIANFFKNKRNEKVTKSKSNDTQNIGPSNNNQNS